MNQPFVYCSRCGAIPGEKSSCVGIYSDHRFTSCSGNVFCRRCGIVPGEKSSCVGIYSDHSFISGSEGVFCRRCGTVPGKKSSCVGIYTDHAFEAEKMGLANLSTVTETDKIDSSLQQAEHHHKAKNSSVVSILFLAADPSDASRLRLGEEYREIIGKLRQSKSRDRFKLELPQLSARPSDISQAMLDTEPQIVHFSGHGTSTGSLCFEDQQGKTQLVQADALAALFKHFSHQVNCVLLNACYSEKQAAAIANHIPYVIGMNKAIGDEAAIAFAVGFYQALGANQQIEDAYKLGCVQIQLQGISEHETPVLLKR